MIFIWLLLKKIVGLTGWYYYVTSVKVGMYYIYTPGVFCYDKHKKNFDIQFSMKRHEPV